MNAKTNYFQEKIETENSKSKWQSLRDLIMVSKKGKAFSDYIVLNIDGELSFDKVRVAKKNKFILYYSCFKTCGEASAEF